MPTYEFRCEKCSKLFEQVWSLAEYDRKVKKTQKCPSCGSTPEWSERYPWCTSRPRRKADERM